MKQPRILASAAMATALAALIGSEAQATDTICAELTRFHRAPFNAQVEPAGRRWVELHWTGYWMDFTRGFGKRCISSPDDASRRLCRWLVPNSSTEFPERLPRRILGCYGYRFPAWSEWRNWRSDVALLDRNRWLLLEIDFLTLSNQTGAIRFSSFAENLDQWTVEMPPIREVRSGRKRIEGAR